MIRCPYCGKQNDDESLFCTECGKPISQDNVCPYCGASVNDDDSFCQSCGKVINESSDIEPIAYEEDEKSGFKKYLLYVIGAFVLLLAIGYFLSNESTNDNGEAQVTDSASSKAEMELIKDSVIVDEETIDVIVDYSLEGLAKVLLCGGGVRITTFENGYALTIKNNKIGAINKNGDIIAAPEYDHAANFNDLAGTTCTIYVSDGLIRLFKNGKYGFIDTKGNVVIPFSFDNTGNFREGLAPVKRGGKWGYIDKKGDEVIPFIYDYATEFNEGLAGITKDDINGYIDSSGEMQITLEPGQKVSDIFVNSLALTNKGFIDKTGKIVIPYVPRDTRFQEGLLIVMNKDDKEGYIDQKGKIVIPCKYGMAFGFYDGLAKVYYEYGGDDGAYIDKTGKEVIQIHEGSPYDTYGNFFEGLAEVSKNKEYGYINKEGELVIPLQYGFARGFHEGLAAVCKDGKWGYIGKSGKVFIPFIYDEAENFHEGLAIVKKDGIPGYVARDGKSTFDFLSASEMKELENLYKYGLTSNKEQQDKGFQEKMMEHTIEITQIMGEINRVYNLYVAAATSTTTDPVSLERLGVNTIASISDLKIEGDMHFREQISLARKEGKNDLVKFFQSEMKMFDEKANRMESSISRDIDYNY